MVYTVDNEPCDVVCPQIGECWLQLPLSELVLNGLAAGFLTMWLPNDR